MSNKENYLNKLETIKSIPNEETLVPNLPMGSYLQECENLYQWALTDLEKLESIGFTKAMLDDLPVRAAACREAQSIWNKDFRSQQIAQQEWKEKSPAVYEMRNALLHAMRYAYRNDAALMGRVSAIADGSGNADMIQDLNDITVLGRQNPTQLLAVGIDEAKLTEAATRSREMATLLAQANGDIAEQNQSKIIRDKAYTHLKQLADEVYAAGKFIFWKDAQRIKGYTSSYWRNTKKAKTPTDTQTTDSTKA